MQIKELCQDENCFRLQIMALFCFALKLDVSLQKQHFTLIQKVSLSAGREDLTVKLGQIYLKSGTEGFCYGKLHLSTSLEVKQLTFCFTSELKLPPVKQHMQNICKQTHSNTRKHKTSLTRTDSMQLNINMSLICIQFATHITFLFLGLRTIFLPFPFRKYSMLFLCRGCFRSLI